MTREIQIFPAAPAGRIYGHMAIAPYPAHLAKEFTLEGGEQVTIRPIRQEDAEIEQTFVSQLQPEAKYFRFMQALKELTPKMLARFTQIDYDREMAFLASVREDGKEVEIGIARYFINPDGESGEFAIVIDTEWQRHGLGTLLMKTLMAEAQIKHLRQIEGQVLAGNYHMLMLMKKLGFTIQTSPDSQDIKSVKYVFPQTSGGFYIKK